jgi:hypothetical protein
VLPAVDWVLKQPENKRLAVIIQNIPLIAKEKNIVVFIKKHVYKAGEKFEDGAFKVNIENDSVTHKSLGRAWVSSTNKTIIVRLLNLHYRVSNLLDLFYSTGLTIVSSHMLLVSLTKVSLSMRKI